MTTHWKFPADLKECPVVSCKKMFKDRESAIAHYKEEHSSNSFFCATCDKPLRIYHLKDLEKHFQTKHPKMKLPKFNVRRRSVKKEVCLGKTSLLLE